MTIQRSDTIIRLHNDDWGYETNCFVCEPRNERGLQIAFFHDVSRVMVTAEFELDDAYSGAPTLLHGGVILAVLDEAMAWACIAIGGQWAVTTETNARFRQVMRVGSRYRVEAEVVEHVESTIRTTARVLDGRDRVRAEADATFVALGEAQVVEWAGRPVDDRHRSDLRD